MTPVVPARAPAPAGDLAFVAALYLLASAVGAAVAVLYAGAGPTRALLAGTTAATVVVWIASAVRGNASLYDPYWSLAPLVMALGLAVAALVTDRHPAPLRALVALAVVTAYAVRLTLNWLRGWHGMRHEDWRYVQIRARTGALWQPVNFLGIHLMPSLMTWGGSLPLVVVFADGGRSFGSLDALGVLIALSGIVLSARADGELHAHRAQRRDSSELLDTGVWGWCRHPNYLGEILFWWGLFALALGADPAAAGTGVGALAITLLFLTVSIGLIEARLADRKPGYAAYRARVPRLLPLGALYRR